MDKKKVEAGFEMDFTFLGCDSANSYCKITRPKRSESRAEESSQVWLGVSWFITLMGKEKWNA